ncbi:MAG: CRISPR system precrRNA processing endoribonuclease RAMP protein Cas6 [Promethearchaeota archaeon]
MFSNLTNLWNGIFEKILKIEKDEFMNWVNLNVFVSSYKIRTKTKEFGKAVPAVGIVGWVNFRILVNNLIYTKLIDLLCQFGQLTNLGGSRTAGLGVIKYLPLKFFKEKE